MHWRYFWDYSGGNVFENMSQQLSFWYRALNLQIPRSATMNGGIYLWKDGREVPDTMSVTLEQPEEMLISWVVGLRQQPTGRHRRCAGRRTAPFSRANQVRYMPQKVNRPDGHGNDRPRRRTCRTRTCRISSIASAPAASRTARSSSATASRSPAAWRWRAIASAARCAGMQEGRDRLTRQPSITMDFGFTRRTAPASQNHSRIHRGGDQAARDGVGRVAALSRWTSSASSASWACWARCFRRNWAARATATSITRS